MNNSILSYIAIALAVVITAPLMFNSWIVNNK